MYSCSQDGNVPFHDFAGGESFETVLKYLRMVPVSSSVRLPGSSASRSASQEGTRAKLGSMSPMTIAPALTAEPRGCSSGWERQAPIANTLDQIDLVAPSGFVQDTSSCTCTNGESSSDTAWHVGQHPACALSTEVGADGNIEIEVCSTCTHIYSLGRSPASFASRGSRVDMIIPGDAQL